MPRPRGSGKPIPLPSQMIEGPHEVVEIHDEVAHVSDEQWDRLAKPPSAPPRYVLLAWLADRNPNAYVAGGHEDRASVWTAIAWADDVDRINFLARSTHPDAHAVVVDTQEGK